jgi:hypothetical protein
MRWTQRNREGGRIARSAIRFFKWNGAGTIWNNVEQAENEDIR